MRFSVRTCLFGVSILGLGLALGVTQYKLHQTQSAYDLLRQSADTISVDDPTLLYVRPIKKAAPRVWSFQFSVPDEAGYRLNVGEGTVDPLTGYPPKIISTEITQLPPNPSKIRQPVISVFLQLQHNSWVVGLENSNGEHIRLGKTPDLYWIHQREYIEGIKNPQWSDQFAAQVLSPLESHSLYRITQNDKYPIGENAGSGIYPGRDLPDPRVFEIWITPPPKPATRKQSRNNNAIALGLFSQAWWMSGGKRAVSSSSR